MEVVTILDILTPNISVVQDLCFFHNWKKYNNVLLAEQKIAWYSCSDNWYQYHHHDHHHKILY